MSLIIPILVGGGEGAWGSEKERVSRLRLACVAWRFWLLSNKGGRGQNFAASPLVRPALEFRGFAARTPRARNRHATQVRLRSPEVGISACGQLSSIDLVTVFDAILTSRQTCEKLRCLYENLMSNNFRETAVLKKNINCKLKLQSKGLY